MKAQIIFTVELNDDRVEDRLLEGSTLPSILRHIEKTVSLNENKFVYDIDNVSVKEVK